MDILLEPVRHGASRSVGRVKLTVAKSEAHVKQQSQMVRIWTFLNAPYAMFEVLTMTWIYRAMNEEGWVNEVRLMPRVEKFEPSQAVSLTILRRRWQRQTCPAKHIVFNMEDGRGRMECRPGVDVSSIITEENGGT
jgi:hypothetical protein